MMRGRRKAAGGRVRGTSTRAAHLDAHAAIVAPREPNPTPVHHLNCISTCPLCGRLMNGDTRSLIERGLLVCHCLLIETAPCLVLDDFPRGHTFGHAGIAVETPQGWPVR